jgi:hypothetical protein
MRLNCSPLFAVLAAVAFPLSAQETPNTQCAFQPIKTQLMRGGDRAIEVTADVTGVQDLYLVVTYGSDNYRSDQAIWAEPKLIDADGRVVEMTTIRPHESQVGWGQLFVNENQKGQPLRIGSQTFDTGFWAHGPSMLHFRLGGKYTQFQAHVGIDAGAGRNGSAEFVVTNTPPEMPDPSVYGGSSGSRPRLPPLPEPPPAATAPHAFNARAAEVLRSAGIDQLVFLRRYTLNANHVYTEYLNSRWTPGGGLCVLDLATGQVRDLISELNDGVGSLRKHRHLS